VGRGDSRADARQDHARSARQYVGEKQTPCRELSNEFWRQGLSA